MPYCVGCGNQVGDGDAYCARCGAPQSAAPPGSGAAAPRRAGGADFISGLSPRTASILCYLPWVGWIAAIVVLAADNFRNNRTVRFHAFQGLYLFVGWLLVNAVFGSWHWRFHGPQIAISGILHMAMLALWIFMIIKTSQEEVYSLPIVGELAERSLAER